MRGLRIGYVLESVYFQPFDDDRSLDKVGVSSEQQLLDMLVRGRIDVLVGTDCQVDYSLLDPKLAGRIAKAAYQPEARTELYIGFSRKRLARMPELAAALDELLRAGWVANAALRYQPAVARPTSAVLVLRRTRQHEFHVPEGSLDLVAVEISDETPVVGLAIIRARPWLAFVLATGCQRRLVKRMHRGLVRSDEAEVAAIA